MRAAYKATCRVIHPDKNEHKDANRAQVAVNQAMTILESPIARSEYHLQLQRMLEKHQRSFAKQKKTKVLGEKLTKQVIKTVDKNKKTTKNAKAGKPADPSKDASAPTEPTENKESSKASQPSTGEGSKEPTKASAGTGKDDKASLKFWDVAGYQVKPHKNWISVRLDSDAIRKFHYNQWQDEAVARQVATEFAKKVSKEMFEFRFAQPKKEKIARMKSKGITCMKGKESVAELEKLFHQARFWAVSLFFVCTSQRKLVISVAYFPTPNPNI